MLSGLRLSPFSRRGFSLVEIMVAMVILVIIVLIVAGIFQQTSLAWSLGLRRADAQSVTRAVVGSLGRDLSMIVDPYNFVALDQSSESADPLGSDYDDGKLSSSLDFYILRPPQDAKERLKGTGSGSKRELYRIRYTGGSTVTRTEEPFEGGSSTRTEYALKGGSVTFEMLSNASRYDSAYTSAYDLPGVQIKVRPQTPPNVNDYEIAVGSCGPDGKWGTEDDIRSWPEGEDR